MRTIFTVEIVRTLNVGTQTKTKVVRFASTNCRVGTNSTVALLLLLLLLLVSSSIVERSPTGCAKASIVRSVRRDALFSNKDYCCTYIAHHINNKSLLKTVLIRVSVCCLVFVFVLDATCQYWQHSKF